MDSGLNTSLYDEDFLAWADRQAALLRAGDVGALDLAHLAEEIEGLGANERRELRRRLARLLQHLLKWTYQPELRSRSWATTIRAQRDEIAAMLEDSPSLRASLPNLLPRAFATGRTWAEAETGLLNLPGVSPWSIAQALAADYLPD
jgi:hypothetical protein